MTGIPTHKAERLHNVFVVYWIKRVLEPDLDWFLQQTENARQEARRPLVGISLITNAVEIPSPAIFRAMEGNMHQVGLHISSAHLVVTTTLRFAAIRATNSVTYFIKGTQGYIYSHLNVQDALAKARQVALNRGFGERHIPVSDEQILTWMKSRGLPTR